MKLGFLQKNYKYFYLHNVIKNYKLFYEISLLDLYKLFFDIFMIIFESYIVEKLTNVIKSVGKKSLVIFIFPSDYYRSQFLQWA